MPLAARPNVTIQIHCIERFAFCWKLASRAGNGSTSSSIALVRRRDSRSRAWSKILQSLHSCMCEDTSNARSRSSCRSRYSSRVISSRCCPALPCGGVIAHLPRPRLLSLLAPGAARAGRAGARRQQKRAVHPTRRQFRRNSYPSNTATPGPCVPGVQACPELSELLRWSASQSTALTDLRPDVPRAHFPSLRFPYPGESSYGEANPSSDLRLLCKAMKKMASRSRIDSICCLPSQKLPSLRLPHPRELAAPYGRNGKWLERMPDRVHPRPLHPLPWPWLSPR